MIQKMCSLRHHNIEAQPLMVSQPPVEVFWADTVTVGGESLQLWIVSVVVVVVAVLGDTLLVG